MFFFIEKKGIKFCTMCEPLICHCVPNIFKQKLFSFQGSSVRFCPPKKGLFVKMMPMEAQPYTDTIVTKKLPLAFLNLTDSEA